MITNCQKQVLLHRNKSQYTVWSWDEVLEMQGRVGAHTPAPSPAGPVLGGCSFLAHWFQGCRWKEDILPTILLAVLDLGTRKVERENQFTQVASDLHTWTMLCACAHTDLQCFKRKRSLHMQSPSVCQALGWSMWLLPSVLYLSNTLQLWGPFQCTALVGSNQHTMESSGVQWWRCPHE